MKNYPNLFSPIKIGSRIVKNRIEVAPISVADLTPEGYLTNENTALYEMRAQGGAGIVTIGESLVDSKYGKAHGRMIPLDNEEILPSLIDTTDAIKRHGALASIELIHAGRRAHPKYCLDNRVIGPSSGESIYGGPIHEMTLQDIDSVVEAFGDAAEMAKLGGVDMVMVHGGHGWLLGQFMSPANNSRKDSYGGSIENRARISIRVIENIRKKCGDSFPIEFRMSGDEFIENGLCLNDAIEIAKLLDDKVDLFHISATSFHNKDAAQRMFPNMFMERGCNVFLAAAIKSAVKTPVVTVGALNMPDHLEEIISTGQADMVAMARALVADPFLPEKARLGHAEDITPCIRCNLCLSGSFVPYIKYATRVSRCSVNPLTGREFEYKFTKQPESHKRVLIVGGGPGGLQAAVTAADRGHEVHLYEKNASLGGALSAATHVSFKNDLKQLKDVLINRVHSRPIHLHLNSEMTPELATELNPDAIILALGSEKLRPKIIGIDSKHVIHAHDLHLHAEQIGQKIVIIGGGLVGCEEGLALALKGKHVTILEQKNAAATDAPFLHWRALMLELETQVDLVLNASCSQINESHVVYYDLDGIRRQIEANHVIIATGSTPLTKEAYDYQYTAPYFYTIGDCNQPGKVMDAIHSGYFTAMSL